MIHKRVNYLEAAKLLADGQVICFPTETVIGLGADAGNQKAVRQIFQIKNRPPFNPLIIHVANIEIAKQYADFSPLEMQLADAFWPGPMTLVLPIKKDAKIANITTAGLQTIGIRIPNHRDSLKMLEMFGEAVAAPSANPSGKLSPTRLEDINYPEHPDLCLLDSDILPKVGLESTILKIEGQDIHILRAGGVSREDIFNQIGLHPILQTNNKDQIDPQRPISPGQLLSHYAPEVPLFMNVKNPQNHSALLDFNNQFVPNPNQPYFDLSPTGDLNEAAKNLFFGLRQIDGSAEYIEVAPIPKVGIGEAIHDRLQKAAAPRKPR